MAHSLQRTSKNGKKNAIFDIFEIIGKYEVIKRVIKIFHKNLLTFSFTY